MNAVWSWRQAIFESNLQATTKLVLSVLGSHLNDMGGSMFPSQARLAKLCSLSERSVITHLEIAESKGWIRSALRQLPGKKWAAKSYTSTYPQEVKELHPKKEGVKEIPSRGEGGSKEGVKEVHTNYPSSNLPVKASSEVLKKIDGKGGYNIINLLSESGMEAARKAAPGWDIYRLGGIYTKNFSNPPDKPDRAFPAWCKVYTKERPPA